MLLKNDIICTKGESIIEFERIIWISRDYNDCITIQMNVDKLILNKRSIIEIKNLFNEGICELYKEDLGLKKILEEEISEIQKKKRDKAYEIIKYIFEQEDEVTIFLNAKVRSKIIKNAINKFNMSVAVIYKYLRIYLQGGRLKDALLPNYNLCGAKGKKKNYNKKSGRKSNEEFVLGKKRGVILDDNIRNIFRVSIERYFNNTKERTLVQAYQLMVQDFFSIVIDDKIELYEPSKVPTFEQFKYFYYKNRDFETVYRNRKGNRKFDLTCRPLMSNSTYESFGPGFRYQIDATMADVYLVSRFDKKSVIGRPILYLVVDVFSRLIVGCFIGLEGPSWNGSASAIYNCTENKVEFCKKYNIEISSEEWPSFGLPEVLLADRGELVGPIGNDIIEKLGIVLENTPSYRGDSKGIVERNFKSINDNLKHWTPGAVKKEHRERGERDYKLDAKLNIDDYTQLVIYSILERNKSFIESYPLTKDMIDDKVKPIPIEIWNWGMKNKTGSLNNVPEDLLKASLLRSDKAVITEKGIKYKKELYITNLDNEKNRYLKSRILGNKIIDIKFDNRDMSIIYMVDKDEDKLIPCYLKKEYQIFFNRTYEEVEDYNYNLVIINKDLEFDKLTNKVEMNSKSKKIVNDAIKRSTGKVNIKNIKDNRKTENSIIRKEQSLSKQTHIENDMYFPKQRNEDVITSRSKQIGFIREMKKKG